MLDAIFFAGLSALFLWRLWVSFPRPGGAGLKRSDRALCIVVLGGGNYTAETLLNLRTLGSLLGNLDFVFITAEIDKLTHTRLEDFVGECMKASAPQVIKVTWDRIMLEQGLFGNFLGTLCAAWQCVRLFWMLRPDLLMCNGPGMCEPFVFAAYVFRVLGIKRVLMLYSEVFQCVDHLTSTGTTMYDFVDCFTVQWPHLLRIYREAEYAGRLNTPEQVAKVPMNGRLPDRVSLPLLPPWPPDTPGPKTAILAAGAHFEDLVLAIDHAEFISILYTMGIRKFKLQIGRGYRPTALERAANSGKWPMEVEIVDFVKWDPRELREAAFVIAQSSAGVISQCLHAGARTLAVLPNGRLDPVCNEVELAFALQEQGLVLSCQASKTVGKLERADFRTLRRFPATPSTTFARCVSDLLYGAPQPAARS